MVVHAPTAVSDFVGKGAGGEYIVLREGIIAGISAGFPFSRQKTDPIEFPILRRESAAVFDVIPYAEAAGDEFAVIFFRIPERVPFAAEFDPPEILIPKLYRALRNVQPMRKLLVAELIRERGAA